MRLLSDARLANNFCDKGDYPSLANPSLQDVATRVVYLDRNFPGIPRWATKWDVDDARKRVDTIRIFYLFYEPSFLEKNLARRKI